MNYLLLFYANARELAMWQQAPKEADAQKHTLSGERMGEQHSPIRKNSRKHLSLLTTNVLLGLGDQYMVTDGPYLEGTEVIGGFADIERAVFPV